MERHAGGGPHVGLVEQLRRLCEQAVRVLELAAHATDRHDQLAAGLGGEGPRLRVAGFATDQVAHAAPVGQGVRRVIHARPYRRAAMPVCRAQLLACGLPVVCDQRRVLIRVVGMNCLARLCGASVNFASSRRELASQRDLMGESVLEGVFVGQLFVRELGVVAWCAFLVNELGGSPRAAKAAPGDRWRS